jgi:hypothetical protein
VGRSPEIYEQEIVSYEGLTKRPYRSKNVRSQEDHVLYIWGQPGIQRIARTLDLMASTRSFLYERRTLFFFCVVLLALRLDKRGAHQFVQGSDRLRAAAGLPPLTEETRNALDAAEDDEDIREEGFPVRQMISEFVNYIEAWLNVHNHEYDEFEGLNFLRREAYEESIVEIFARHPEQRADLVGMDGTKIFSPTCGPDRKRPDHGAAYYTKGKNRDYCRVKFTAAFGTLPLAFYSQIVSPPLNELAVAQSEFVPGLTAHIERLRGRVAEAPALAGLHGALVCGDGIFNNSRLVEKLIEHDLMGGFRKPNALVRNIVGQRQVKARGRTAILDVADNGDHYCDCDRTIHRPGCNGGPDCGCTQIRPLHEREPMKHRLHSRGHNGGVHFECIDGDPNCPNRKHRFYVGYRKPNLAPTGEKIADPPPAYNLVSPLSRSDIRYHALVFKASQAIEHYHVQLGSQLGIAINDRHGDRRHFFGNFATEFWFTLGDLIWNLRIGLNLDRFKRDSRKQQVLGWEHLFFKAVNQWHEIWLKTDGKRLDGESDADCKKRQREERPQIGAYYLGAKRVT